MLRHWVKDHPAEVVGVVASGVVSVFPELITGPVLWAAGFGGLGPVGGELHSIVLEYPY